MVEPCSCRPARGGGGDNLAATHFRLFCVFPRELSRGPRCQRVAHTCVKQIREICERWDKWDGISSQLLALRLDRQTHGRKDKALLQRQGAPECRRQATPPGAALPSVAHKEDKPPHRNRPVTDLSKSLRLDRKRTQHNGNADRRAFLACGWCETCVLPCLASKPTSWSVSRDHGRSPWTNTDTRKPNATDPPRFRHSGTGACPHRQPRKNGCRCRESTGSLSKRPHSTKFRSRQVHEERVRFTRSASLMYGVCPGSQRKPPVERHSGLRQLG